MLVTINRTDYWQCAFVIGKGGIDRVHARGIDAFRSDIADGAPFLADRVSELNSFDDVKLLSVSVDRLNSWSKPGLLCIGDAAHAMSPVGGVGINLAIQDAVAAANLLAAKLKAGTVTANDLDGVRRRREFPVRVIQAMQVAVHNRVLRPLARASHRPGDSTRARPVSGCVPRAPRRPPWPLRIPRYAAGSPLRSLRRGRCSIYWARRCNGTACLCV
jgi:2-polyprenyl-6-methoxyphenol hydroxylase-like FAD-dependent oxidoreductase